MKKKYIAPEYEIIENLKDEYCSELNPSDAYGNDNTKVDDTLGD